MALPLEPPLKPQLARSAKALPKGEDWRYEPKWDGFRTIAFRDGDDVYLQSRNGKPMNRYFPEIVEQIAAVKPDRFVIDGEMVIVIDEVQEFDILSQRIHPAESRVQKLAAEYPAAFVAFDVLAVEKKTYLDRPYDERRAALEDLVEPPIQLTPMTPDPEVAGIWLQGNSEGAMAKEAGGHYLPGERRGMVKVKRIRTADVAVVAYRLGKEGGTVGSLILGLFDDDGNMHVVGHTSGFTQKQKRELLPLLEQHASGERGSAEPSRWRSDEELQWEGLEEELVCEIAFDHITGTRIRHGAKFLRWRSDKSPRECSIEQLRA